jgi:hypothetical protein
MELLCIVQRSINSTRYYYYNERGIEDLYQYHPVGKGRYLPFPTKRFGPFLIDSRGNTSRGFLNYEDVENILGLIQKQY